MSLRLVSVDTRLGVLRLYERTWGNRMRRTDQVNVKKELWNQCRDIPPDAVEAWRQDPTSLS